MVTQWTFVVSSAVMRWQGFMTTTGYHDNNWGITIAAGYHVTKGIAAVRLVSRKACLETTKGVLCVSPSCP